MVAYGWGIENDSQEYREKHPTTQHLQGINMTTTPCSEVRDTVAVEYLIADAVWPDGANVFVCVLPKYPPNEGSPCLGDSGGEPWPSAMLKY